MKREAKFTLRFRSWIKANPMHNAAFELKQTTTESLSFSAVKEHQINALLAVKRKTGFLYKISDESREIKPFDMFYFRNSYAWIVIKYPKFFVIVDVDHFVLEKDRSKRKSLTSARAKDIAWATVRMG